MVYTTGGDVLMLQRRDPPDFWQSVTGSLEPGEPAVDAARRELQEETGLRPEKVELVAEQLEIEPEPGVARGRNQHTIARVGESVKQDLEHAAGAGKHRELGNNLCRIPSEPGKSRRTGQQNDAAETHHKPDDFGRIQFLAGHEEMGEHKYDKRHHGHKDSGEPRRDGLLTP